MAGEGLASPETKSWLYQPAFPEKWERRPLYSLANWVNGLAFRDIQFSEAGKPVIKIAEIKGGISGQTKFTTQVFDESVHVRAGDLLFSWSGQPETSIDVFWWRGPDGWLNQHSFRVTPAEEIDPTFFFYLLRYLKPSFIGIARNKQTTGLGHVTKRDLENIEAAYPALSEQRAIAHILGTLDDKIELNRRMNETLEAMARALFKSWFVDFDPVRAKAAGRDPGLPQPLANLFPDSFEGSELREIPSGWRVVNLGDPDVFPLVTPGGFSDHTTRMSYVATGDVIHDHISNESVADLNTLPSRANMRPGSGRIWFAKMKDSPKYLWTMTEDDNWWSRRVLSTGFAGIQATSMDYESLLYCFVISAEFDQAKNGLATGTTMQALNNETISKISIVMPPLVLAKRFNEVVRPLFRRRWSNSFENHTLTTLRDTLLPKLISGELRVIDAEKLIGKAS